MSVAALPVYLLVDIAECCNTGLAIAVQIVNNRIISATALARTNRQPQSRSPRSNSRQVPLEVCDRLSIVHNLVDEDDVALIPDMVCYVLRLLEIGKHGQRVGCADAEGHRLTSADDSDHCCAGLLRERFPVV